MGETRETIRLTMTVDEATHLADFLSRNKNYEFEASAVDDPDDESAMVCLAQLRVGYAEKLDIKIQMAILRSQL